MLRGHGGPNAVVFRCLLLLVVVGSCVFFVLFMARMLRNSYGCIVLDVVVVVVVVSLHVVVKVAFVVNSTQG